MGKSGGAFNLVLSDSQVFRQHIIFSLEQNDLTNCIGYVQAFYLNLYGHTAEKPALTEMPNPAGISPPQFHVQQTDWVMSNLKIVEKMFAKILYSKHMVFVNIQSVLSTYRQSLMFNLDHKRDPHIATGLVEIMNIMLPPGHEAELPPKPVKNLFIPSTKYEKDLSTWALNCLIGIEFALSTYLRSRMVANMH